MIHIDTYHKHILTHTHTHKHLNFKTNAYVYTAMPEEGEKNGKAMLFFTPQAAAIDYVLSHYHSSMVLFKRFKKS